MKKTLIPKKKKGEFRTIYKPSPTETQILKDIFPTILNKALSTCNLDVCQGFFPNTSPVTNASKHIGYKYTTVFDLKDFFDSINITHLSHNLTKEELDIVLVDGAPRQGLSTSPIVANLAATGMDKWILNILAMTGPLKEKYSIVDDNIVYTRYADDLAFSYNDYSYKNFLLKIIPSTIKFCGFSVNPNKTRTMSSKNGRRIITGIGVDDSIHPTRRMKRKMRSALYNEDFNKYIGLKEWCKLKKPKNISKLEIEELKNEFPTLLDSWSNNQHTFSLDSQ